MPPPPGGGEAAGEVKSTKLLLFRSLASGSSGNATVIEAREGAGARPTRIAVDCGLPERALGARALAAGVDLTLLDALFITHEHSDHLGCALGLAARTQVPVWASRGTWDAALEGAAPALRLAIAPLMHIARDGQTIALGGLEIHPFTTPHDAREPLQLRVGDGSRTLGMLTDCGYPSAHALECLAHCHALLLESNHDSQMLAASRYPPRLKARIASAHGHLSNQQAQQALAALNHRQLSVAVAAHLSEQNNTPELVKSAWAQTLGCQEREVLVSGRGGLAHWFEV